MVALGPLQLVVIGLADHSSASVVTDIVRQINEPANVTLLDAVVANKSSEGGISVLDDLTKALVDTGGMSGVLRHSLFGGGTDDRATAHSDVHSGFLSDLGGDFGVAETQVLEIADLIPKSSSVLFLLIEHRWELRFKDAVIDSGCSVLANALITPATLVAMGMKSVKPLD